MRNAGNRISVTGRAGLPAVQPRDRLLRLVCEVPRVDNFFSHDRSTVGDLLLDFRHVTLCRQDVTMPRPGHVHATHTPACPASPIHRWHDTMPTTTIEWRSAEGVNRRSRVLHGWWFWSRRDVTRQTVSLPR